jgi:hypothetical protein
VHDATIELAEGPRVRIVLPPAVQRRVCCEPAGAAMAAGLAIPFVQSLAAVITLITIAVSAAHRTSRQTAPWSPICCARPAMQGGLRPFLSWSAIPSAFWAPIVTGYVVTATGSFNTAFAVAGALALVGAVAALALVRGTLGEHARPSRASPSLAS